ncbi:hypothetical protein B0J11DRAFT_581829 [Dendryphion nanum]|uniref:SET domain-containing protein n=1 Tax=Dendryphion nanum TaxID=256645 RepID=A0A9P9IJ11_9PLEO|nr:hypothetical protein B0J11DRAFT_581829 [Dendryphion nanum]
MHLPSILTISPSSLLLLLLPTLPFTTPTLTGSLDINDLLDPLTGALKPQAYLGAAQNPSLTSNTNSKQDDPNPWAPWTHEPLCTHSTSLTSLGQKYCLYTHNSSFLNGFSLLTTPKIAKHASQFLSEHPIIQFFSEAKGDEWIRTPRPYRTMPVAGKDLGVVATRKIKAYETFMVDQASVVMDLEMEKAVSRKEGMRLLKVGVERLRSPGLVRGLSKKHDGSVKVGGEGSEKKKTEEEEEEEEEVGQLEEDVLMTNAFGTTLGEGNFRALFPIISRINHACEPNSFVMFSQTGFSLGIKAYRDIEPGEEITISYLLLGQPSDKRQEGLKRWGFKCTCSLCKAPKHILSASDARRNLIIKREVDFNKAWKDGRYQAAIRYGEELLDLLDKEKLYPLMTDEYVVLARLHLLNGEKEKAEEYKDLAVALLGRLGFLGGGDEWEEGKDAEGLEWTLEKLFEMYGEAGVYI